MIKQFFLALGDISPILPSIVRFLILLLATTLVWVVLSIPAFWLCRTVGAFLTSAISALGNARRQIFARSFQLFQLTSAPLERFVVAHAQMFSLAGENRQLQSEMRDLRVAVESIPNRIHALESGIVDAGNKFSGAADNLSNLETPAAMAPPSPQEFSEIQKGRNGAAVTLVLPNARSLSKIEGWA